jgi:DNA-binding MarR family transcriptional regulator
MYRYGQSYISKKLEPYKIGSGQYVFLLALNRNDGISQEELSDDLRIDKATTAKAVKKLIEDGYISRDINAGDKRAYRVFLTDKAKAVLPIVLETIDGWETNLTAGMTWQEKRQMNDLLYRMAENAYQIKANDEENPK